MNNQFAGLSHMFMRRLKYSLALMAISVLCLSCGSPGLEDQVLPPTAQVTVNAPSQLVTMDVKNAANAQLTGSQGTPPPATRSWGHGGSTVNNEARVPIGEDVPLDELKHSFSQTKDPALRSAMLDAMADRGEEEEKPVAPVLATALLDGDEEVRTNALDLLKTTSEPVPLGPLTRMAATDSNPDLRMEAMTLMSDQLFAGDRTEEEWAVVRTSLSGSLSDPNPDVREQAEMLLSDFSQSAH